jgi:hypothetical protein
VTVTLHARDVILYGAFWVIVAGAGLAWLSTLRALTAMDIGVPSRYTYHRHRRVGYALEWVAFVAWWLLAIFFIPCLVAALIYFVLG